VLWHPKTGKNLTTTEGVSVFARVHVRMEPPLEAMALGFRQIVEVHTHPDVLQPSRRDVEFIRGRRLEGIIIRPRRLARPLPPERIGGAGIVIDTRPFR
jgi:hypothetical protein